MPFMLGDIMNFEQAKEKAVKFLVLQLRTEKEVYDKLKKIEVDEEIIDEVITYLKSIRYIDDEKYVEAYLRQCSNIPKYSLYEIKMKLIAKGIDKELVKEKIENWEDEQYENKLTQKLLNTKLKNMEPLKQKAYLYRRGFKINSSIDD